MITVPVAEPWIGEEEIDAVGRVLRSGMLAQGAKVLEFEEKFARYCGTEYAVAVNNGTAALHAALSAHGIGPGDEVIVPDFSFIASATCVNMCGARPVFADVDDRTYTLSAEALLEAIGPATRAVIGVHLFGQPFSFEEIREICDDHHLVLIEDAAQAHGAAYQGKKAGSLGDGACFSFYPTKNMTTGEGGMITTDDRRFAEQVRVFINHGQTKKYLHESLGYNYRMTDIAAAIGVVQLGRLEEFNRKRIENANFLTHCLEGTGIITPYCPGGMRHVYHQYVIRVNDACGTGRDELARSLGSRGVGTAVHYPTPIHQQPVYQAQNDPEICPVSRNLAAEVLSLPVHPHLSRDQLEYMHETIAGMF